jgi:hypothetical protein
VLVSTQNIPSQRLVLQLRHLSSQNIRFQRLVLQLPHLSSQNISVATTPSQQSEYQVSEISVASPFFQQQEHSSQRLELLRSEDSGSEISVATISVSALRKFRLRDQSCYSNHNPNNLNIGSQRLELLLQSSQHSENSGSLLLPLSR